MLQFSGLGDPCSPGDADYNPNDPICAAFYAPPAAGGTSQSGTCNTDSDCSSGMECNAVSWFCEPSGAQGSSKQATQAASSTNQPLNPSSAIRPGAAAALPSSSTKIALVLLAIMGAAGIGWVAYGRMKRSKA
jgi:hypothetical protein